MPYIADINDVPAVPRRGACIILCILVALSFGCISSNAVSRQYVFPGNTGRQIERHIDARGE